MAKTASEKPFGQRYLRYVRGLPAHPERAFGEHAERWRFREYKNNEVFTATRRTRDKVWRVIFELDDGGTFLEEGAEGKGNFIMCIAPLEPNGGLMIRDSSITSIDGSKFLQNELLLYRPDGRLNDATENFHRDKRKPASISGVLPFELIDSVRRAAGGEQGKKSETVQCKIENVDGEFQLNFGADPENNQATIRLERGTEGFASHTVPLRLGHPKDAINCLRKKINLEAGRTLI